MALAKWRSIRLSGVFRPEASWSCMIMLHTCRHMHAGQRLTSEALHMQYAGDLRCSWWSPTTAGPHAQEPRSTNTFHNFWQLLINAGRSSVPCMLPWYRLLCTAATGPIRTHLLQALLFSCRHRVPFTACPRSICTSSRRMATEEPLTKRAKCDEVTAFSVPLALLFWILTIICRTLHCDC